MENALCQTHPSYFHILQYVQVSSGLNHYFLSYHVHRQTDTQTERYTERHEYPIVVNRNYKYVVPEKAEDLPNIAINTVVHAHKSFLSENNVASDVCMLQELVKEMLTQIIPEIEFAKHRPKPEIIFFKSTRNKRNSLNSPK